MGASSYIIVRSHGQAVSSWKIQPTVSIALLSSVSNFAIGTALPIGVAITWWRSTLRGNTLVKLHHIWNRGMRWDSAPFLLTDFTVGKVAIVAMVISATKFLNNPLLQRATSIKTEIIASPEAMKLDLARIIPDMWMGTIFNDSALLVTTSSQSLTIAQQWWRNDTIITKSEDDYHCNGVCQGAVAGAGLRYDCVSNTTTLDFSTVENNWKTVFSVNMTMPETSPESPFILLEILYSSAVSSACMATLTLETCNISTAVVEYPITIQNTTVALEYPKLRNKTIVSKYVSVGDTRLGRIGAPAGPLAGISSLFGSYMGCNITAAADISAGSNIVSGVCLPGALYKDSEGLLLDKTAAEKCRFTWFSPTDYILSSLDDYMFRAALRIGNGTETQNFTVQRSTPRLVFQSDYRYLGAALGVVALALFATITLLWGWWELDRSVTLSPLETARALQASMAEHEIRASEIHEILKEAGNARFRGGEKSDGLLSNGRA
ncbi:hypothetical protein GP486_005428 [Trichoglossum hirsutum]|uniref:Transmembrane protein n=1 Tax=Trichoglossum hirsutum TaxID=265104 RepID=A0A9P8RMR7_9PEZI|nr:hypothetical protein GP486_005428 [Trichoglossum hirsutum]